MKFYAKNKRQPLISVVSMIDILAILLIFFIVTTTFKRTQPQVVINLPESTEAVDAPSDIEPILIAIDAGAVVYFDGLEVPVDGLEEFIGESLEARPGHPFAMQADEDAPFGIIVRVLDALQARGVENIPAFTERPQ